MSYNLTGVGYGFAPSTFGNGVIGNTTLASYISVPIPITAASDFTIEARLSKSTATTFQIAYGIDGLFFAGIRGDGQYSVQYHTSGAETAVSAGAVPTDSLFHLLTFTSSKTAGTNIFLDGVLMGSNATALAGTSAADFTVLNLRQSNLSWYGGIDEIVIWDSVKRTVNFTPDIAPTPNNAPGLIALYHFDGNLIDSANLPASKISLNGPSVGLVNTASSNFTVSSDGALAANVTVTPSDANSGGTFAPTSIVLSNASLNGTFTYTPATNGAKTISITNTSTLANAVSLTYTVSTLATALFITGPSVSRSLDQSAPFTVSANGALNGDIVVTPSDSSGGVFTPNAITLNAATSNATFTYVAATSGNKSISITNNGGLTNPTALVVVANPAKLASPTASTVGNRVVTVGTGQQYTTLHLFADYLATQNLLTNQEIIIAECYENVSLSIKKIAPLGCSQDYYCIIRPVPGYDEASLNPSGPVIFGTEGIQLTLVSAQVSVGMSIQNFNILCPDGVPYDASCTFANFGLSGRPYELIRNRILSKVFNKPSTFFISTDYSSGVFTDNTYEQVGTANFSQGAYGNVTISRNTFIVKSGGTGAGLISLLGNYSGGSIVQNNAFINYGGIPFSTQSNLATNCSNNYTNTALTSPISGFIAVTTPAFVVSSSDLRPASGSPLLGNAGSSAISINDIDRNNRGLTPDVGAVQLVPAVPLPTGTVNSQPSPDGQNVTISFSTTGTPSSGVANMTASSANPAGAISTLGVITFGSNTGTATWTGIPPGNYSPSIKISNSGGAGDVLGVGGVTIMGISGNPTAAPAPQGPATSLALSGPSSGTTGALSQDFTVTLNGTISTNVAVSLASSVAGDSFTPTSLTLTASTLTATFNVTASSTGQRNISITNNGGLTNPGALSYNSIATPIVSGITISPTNSTGSQQFTSVVSGTNNPSQAVTWTCSRGSISSTGLFTPPAATNAVQNITVTARSVQDSTFAAVASVSIATAPIITRKISFTVTDINGVPLANLIGLKAAVFAETAPDVYNAPIYKQSGVTTNALGLMEFIFPCSLAIGTIVGLDISNTNGTTSQAPSAIGFTGPVALI